MGSLYIQGSLILCGSGFSQCPGDQMNASLVNFMGNHHLPVHVSARPPVVPQSLSSTGVCPEEASQGGCSLRMFRSRYLPCPNPSVPTFNLLPRPDFLPSSHSGSCCPMSLFIHCLLLKVYTPETKRKKKKMSKKLDLALGEKVFKEQSQRSRSREGWGRGAREERYAKAKSCGCQ